VLAASQHTKNATAENAFAYAPPRCVKASGQVLGCDPDPRIRLQLMREGDQRNGSGGGGGGGGGGGN
jgi:hypothetical protein